jgi:hypothetical protein
MLEILQEGNSEIKLKQFTMTIKRILQIFQIMLVLTNIILYNKDVRL